VTVDGYWIDNRIYCTLQPSRTESLRTPSALHFTTEYITTTLQSLYPPQPLFWHLLPTLPWLLPNSRFPSFLSWPPTHWLSHSLSGIYNLWTDCGEDTLSEGRPFLGTDSKETSISCYQVTPLVPSGANHSLHVTISSFGTGVALVENKREICLLSFLGMTYISYDAINSLSFLPHFFPILHIIICTSTFNATCFK
jgi:hypothetical protein